MESRLGSFQSDRLSNRFDGRLAFARLVRGNTQQVPGIRMTGLGGRDLPQNLPGGLEPPGAKVRQSNGQEVGGLCHLFAAKTTQPYTMYRVVKVAAQGFEPRTRGL